jgi:hypothetical protein
MSLRKSDFLSISRTTLAILLLLSALPLIAQYPGQVTKTSHDAPVLRSIAVLEWTGEPGHPKTSRLVPVAVFDGSRIEGDQLQDGGIYMARPQPLALSGEVEYELQQNGHPLGLFDIKNAGKEQGSWVGYGSWKPLPAPKPKPSMAEVARSLRERDDEESDQPILHRKHPASETPSGTGSTGPSTTSAPSNPAPAPDSDRPTLKKGRTKPPEDIGHVDSLPDVTDHNRPRLMRGKSSNKIEVLPTLMGLPPDMQQAVAVSDAKTRPEHPWTFIWANPDDEAKMKSAMESMARDALGLTPPPPPPAPRKPTSRKSAQPAPAPPPPVPLLDENFRVFELAYGSGATLVLTARTGGPLNQQKFVTLIAQPDFYANLLILLKYVAGGAHLDDTPRMRLIDAVDALADNRGELLFELRGATQRQFALYRVLRGQAEKLFTTGPGEFGQEIR